MKTEWQKVLEEVPDFSLQRMILVGEANRAERRKKKYNMRKPPPMMVEYAKKVLADREAAD